MHNAAPLRRPDWLVPTGLIALGLVPALAGVLRLSQIAVDAPALPENARFLAAPWPVGLHLVSALIYSFIGAFQFSPGLRRRHLAWHRAAGRLLVPCGMVAALSALWMVQFYPVGTESPARFDSVWVSALRWLAGSAMFMALWTGLAAARRRDIPAHRAWMIRAYALGLGAGTQVLTHLPWFLWPAIQGETARTLAMAAGWAINLAVAEWLIARQRAR